MSDTAVRLAHEGDGGQGIGLSNLILEEEDSKCHG
jgi:hypothetical protein